jgi:Hpt domain.
VAAGADKEAILVRTEAVLAPLSAEYLAWARGDLDRLRADVAALRRAPADSAALRRMYAVAHDMKDQATTFGYPLLTRIGHALCRFLENEPALGEHNLAHLSLLVESVATVLERRLGGDGGAEGRDLMSRLV